jgi:hypothetical protein
MISPSQIRPKGEIEALHADVNRVQAEYAEIGVRVVTLERLVRELQETK